MRRKNEGRGWVIARRPPPPRPGKTGGRVAPGGPVCRRRLAAATLSLPIGRRGNSTLVNYRRYYEKHFIVIVLAAS
ncbi:hypothetical protein [Azospirillum endophyticum]